VFLASAVAIWVAGIKLSNYPDVLSDRLHLAAALGGPILLAVATNLPEIAITLAASLNGQIDVAVSNVLGGIAIQTVVLVALDAFGVRVKRPLTYQAESLMLVLEGAVVVAVLGAGRHGCSAAQERGGVPAQPRRNRDRHSVGGRAAADPKGR